MTRRNPLALCRALPLLAGLLAAAFTSFAAAPPAHAEILQLSATAFVSRGVVSSTDNAGAGMLQNATGQYYSIVPFPVAGMRVCRFSLWYRDFDVDHNLTARLLRKNVSAGGIAFTPPVVMAQVASTGAVDTMRRASDTTITDPVISPGAAFYYVDLDIPFSALQTVGVQIVYKATCP
ncbi:MAG: hypothetical protein ACT4SY_01070 [Hyphomicrobiales bacterium]